jgi:hypothetical protein
LDDDHHDDDDDYDDDDDDDDDNDDDDAPLPSQDASTTSLWQYGCLHPTLNVPSPDMVTFGTTTSS